MWFKVTEIFQVSKEVVSFQQKKKHKLNQDCRNFSTTAKSHFLSLNHKTGCPDIDVDNTDIVDNGKRLVAMWKAAQNQLDQFWKVWSNDYLHVLRERGNRIS